jgi:hypothetical protein
MWEKVDNVPGKTRFPHTGYNDVVDFRDVVGKRIY